MRNHVLVFVLLVLSSVQAFAQTAGLSPDAIKQIDSSAQQILQATGVPSASIAVVQDNKVIYLRAYGDARVEPKQAATPEMRYSVGSISKQFCSTAVLTAFCKSCSL